MKVQVRRRGVAEEAQLVTGLDCVSNLDLDAALLRASMSFLFS